MSTSPPPDELEIIALAERYLDERSTVPDPEFERLLDEKIRTWEDRLEQLDPEDPLAEVIASELADKRKRLAAIDSDGNTAKRAFLERVSQRFRPQNEWLNPIVLRAINRALFDKYGDMLVVDQQLIEPDSTLDEDVVYEVAMVIRDHAATELEAMDGRGD
ncbi:MAG: hypothetical protein U5K37_06200 [Natrialbaceae archaeon]|nr:hypothetical protein [Natrialbaceae archaeon]